MTQVLFPDKDLVVHEPATLSARILRPGQYVQLDELPDYQKEAALAGKIPFARVLEQSDADLLLAEAERAKNLLIDQGEIETPVFEQFVEEDPVASMTHEADPEVEPVVNQEL